MKLLNIAFPDSGCKALFLGLTASVLIVLGPSFNVQAQQSQVQSLTPEEEAFADRITQRVLQNLRRDGVLDDSIDQGIQRYIKRQRDAQANARKAGQERSAAAAKHVRPVSAARDHIYGNPDAGVSLIEYSDFECPFCKRFHLTAKRIVEAYAGKVNWVYRHFPLAFHNPGARTQAEASECAASLGGNNAFWKFADKIYARTRSNGNGFPIQALAPLAVEIGLDESAFRECLKSGKFSARVQEDFDEGVRIGISGTPGNILLNRQTGEVISRPGAVPYGSLKQSVERLLKTSG